MVGRVGWVLHPRGLFGDGRWAWISNILDKRKGGISVPL